MKTVNSRQLPLAFLLKLCLLMTTACANKDAVEIDNKVSLFNGKNLAGWTSSAKQVWSVSDGSIVAMTGGQDSMLVSENAYQHYRLRIEFWIDSKTNSGVFVHCDTREKITPFNCYEVNIWDEHPKQEYRTGAIVAVVSPPLAHASSTGQWNTLLIESSADRFRVYVNGTLTAEIQNPERQDGYIALQRFNAGEVKFRSVVLEQL